MVADPSDAPRGGESTCPSRDFKGLDTKGIDQVKLAALYGILTDTALDPAFRCDDAIRSTGSDEGW